MEVRMFSRKLWMNCRMADQVGFKKQDNKTKINYDKKLWLISTSI